MARFPGHREEKLMTIIKCENNLIISILHFNKTRMIPKNLKALARRK